MTASQRRWLVLKGRKCRDAAMARRYRIVVLLADRRPVTTIATMLGCDRNTVYAVRDRWRDWGAAGLIDRREDNGDLKATEEYLGVLRNVLEKTPQDFRWPRPTWTRELLIETMVRKRFPRVHTTTMSRALKSIGARKGRPKPVVGCPWPKAAKTRRVNQILAVIEKLGPREVAVYEDEVDIHLNPKIGSDWMLRGQQRTVMTPGQNVKRYIAGAKNAKTKEMTWVSGTRKNSGLFIHVLAAVLKRYAWARRIHVILDNFKIHDSRQTRAYVESLGGRIRLHFLPPYDPDDNRIERDWLDLHANVTRNHRRRRMSDLMADCARYLRARNRQRVVKRGRRAA